MATDRMHEVLSDKLATAAALAGNAEQAMMTDTPDWSDALDILAKLAATVESATDSAVRAARYDGLTWDQIGRGLGVTKQAAQQRWGR